MHRVSCGRADDSNEKILMEAACGQRLSPQHPAACRRASCHPPPRAGVGFGIVATGVASLTDRALLEAARAIAAEVTQEELAQESILPHISRIRYDSHNGNS